MRRSPPAPRARAGVRAPTRGSRRPLPSRSPAPARPPRPRRDLGDAVFQRLAVEDDAAHDPRFPVRRAHDHHTVSPEAHGRVVADGVQRCREGSLDELVVGPADRHPRLHQLFRVLAPFAHDGLDHRDGDGHELEPWGSKERRHGPSPCDARSRGAGVKTLDVGSGRSRLDVPGANFRKCGKKTVALRVCPTSRCTPRVTPCAAGRFL